MMYPIEVTSQQIASIRLQFHTNLDIFFFLSNEKQRKKIKEREKCKSTIFLQQILNSRLLFTIISEKKII